MPRTSNPEAPHRLYREYWPSAEEEEAHEAFREGREDRQEEPEEKESEPEPEDLDARSDDLRCASCAVSVGRLQHGLCEDCASDWNLDDEPNQAPSQAPNQEEDN